MREGFRPITIADRDHLDARLRSAAYPLCEYCFATLFCWQACNRTTWSVMGDWLLLRFEAEGHERYLCPVGSGDPLPAIEWCMNDLASRGHPPLVTMVPHRVVTSLPRGACRVEPDPANADYVYAREHLANLPGRRYSRKRNFVRRFARACDFVFHPMTADDVPECLEVVDSWRAEASGNKWLDYEVDAVRACLMHLEALRQTAAVLRVNGRVLGFAVGEALTHDTFVVHYEKALRECDGAYPTITHEFARLVPERFAYVNREQDLGIEGLRVAKESWFPVRLEPAFVLSPGH